jgi:hypothetical protein
MNDAPEFKETPVIFIGRAETTDHKMGALYIPVELYKNCETVEQVRALSSVFVAKDMPRAVGAVYTANVNLDEHGKIERMRGAPKFNIDETNKIHVRRDFKATWEAHDEAARVAARARKTYDKIAKDSQLEKSLTQLRMQWGQTDKIGRLALEVVVLHVLRN